MKEMDKKYSFGLLVFINLAILPVCFVLDVIFVDLNDHVILVPIFLQLVQVWMNYLFTHGGRRMLLLDGISFLAAAFGVWMMIQSYDYIYSNYPAREDPVVSVYVVLPWLVLEFLMIAVIQLRYCQIKRKKLFTLTRKDMELWPEQIALGDEYFYVCGRNGEWESEIIKLDYKSRIISRKKMKTETKSLVCREGVLYIGSGTAGTTEGTEGGYVDHYLVEEDFETGEPKACEADAQGVFRLGNTILFDHGYRGFSTNPRIPQHSGCDEYDIYPHEEDEYATRWVRLVKDRLEKEGLLDRYHMSVNEYQRGKRIFGTINVYATSFMGVYNIVHVTGISYQIDCEKESIEDWKDWGKVWMILNSPGYVVYQDRTQIMRENLLTGERECLAECENDRKNSYEICGDHLGYYEGEKRIWVRWNKDTF